MNVSDEHDRTKCEQVAGDILRSIARHGASRCEIDWLARRMGMNARHVRSAVEEAHAFTNEQLSEIYRRLMDVLDHASASGNDPLEALKNIYWSHVDFLIRNSDACAVLNHILVTRDRVLRDRVQRIIRIYEHEISIVLQHARTRHMIRSTVDSKAAAILFVGLIQALVVRAQIISDAEILRHEAQGMLRFYMNGISDST